MASFTHTITPTYKTDVGQIVSAPKSYTGDEETDWQGAVAGNTTNQTATLNLIAANIVSMLLVSDQALTIKTNSTTAPQDTITLKANVPIIWTTDSWDNKPFAGNVTNMFFTNGGATAANVNIRILSQQ